MIADDDPFTYDSRNPEANSLRRLQAAPSTRPSSGSEAPILRQQMSECSEACTRFRVRSLPKRFTYGCLAACWNWRCWTNWRRNSISKRPATRGVTRWFPRRPPSDCGLGGGDVLPRLRLYLGRRWPVHGRQPDAEEEPHLLGEYRRLAFAVACTGGRYCCLGRLVSVRRKDALRQQALAQWRQQRAIPLARSGLRPKVL
jgi:hypothetical protein